MLEVHLVFKTVVLQLANTLRGDDIPCGQVLRATGRDLKFKEGTTTVGSVLMRILKLLDADLPRLLLECSEGSSVLLSAEFA
ncbi:hypothetical protein L1987_15365 [Smallanthus sonchifolius]|uniref:Uncharacterized protein n=1 Tax=Smallanthus sonchifolius TaxID=185202 RepID=A0ACB9J7K1_9ASTR|nr:hypothetical protein L1987_15365 [Smallanthus sonchifolius]